MFYSTAGGEVPPNPRRCTEGDAAASTDRRWAAPPGLHSNDPRDLRQSRSKTSTRTLVESHLGWRKVARRWMYRHANGAIGSSSPNGELGTLLARVTLPAVSTSPLMGLQWCLFVERMATTRISLPLLAAIFRAPTLSFLPFEGSLALVGPVGARQRSLALVASSPWGLSSSDDIFPRIYAPLALYQAKDMVVVIDDDVCDGVPEDPEGGLLSDSLAHAGAREWLNLPHRGLLLSVSSHIDLIESVNAGTLVLAVARNDVDETALTHIQNARGALAEAMSSYIAWLSRRADDLQRHLLQRYAAWLHYFEPLVPTAMAATAADLMPGAELLGLFARDVGALDDRARAEFVDRVRVALLDCIEHWQLPR